MLEVLSILGFALTFIGVFIFLAGLFTTFVPGAWVSVGFIITVVGFVCSISSLKANNSILAKIGLGLGSAFFLALIIGFLHFWISW